MATIYKRGKYWWISYRDRNGVRVQQSTGLKDRNSALILKKHYTHQEKSYRLSGTPLAKPIRFEIFRAEHLQLRTGRRSRHTIRMDDLSLNSLAATLQDRNPHLNKITTRDIETWYSHILMTASSATANTYYRHVRAFFNLAVKKKYLAASPCDIETAIEPEKIIRVLTHDEVSRILNGMPNAWRQLTLAGIYTGARRSELCRMRVEDMNLDAGTVTINSNADNPTKAKRFRVIPLPEFTLDFFRGLSASGSGPLLTTQTGTTWKPDWISHGFKRYAQKQGIECSFHDIRKTYGAWLIMSGADLVTVKENMGHHDISITIKHYVHLDIEHKQKQVNKMPRLM